MVHTIRKGIRKDLDCQCNDPRCIFTHYTDEAEESHDAMVEEFGEGIVTMSAFRCAIHNRRVGGVRNSNHVWGDGRDYTAKDFQRLIETAKKHWRYVKVYPKKRIIHCDNRKNKE